jgi:hypothetical protein
MLCQSAQGFVYAVTMTGTTGKSGRACRTMCWPTWIECKACSPVPVCAGFGIRSREQVARLRRTWMAWWWAPRWSNVWSAAGTSAFSWAALRSGYFGERAGEASVYRAATLLQVAHARNVLITAGIQCELRNQYLAGAMGDLPMMETWPQTLRG